MSEVHIKSENAELSYAIKDEELVIEYTNKLYHHNNTTGGWNTGAYFAEVR